MKTITSIEQRSRRICERIDLLASYSEMEGALFRPFCCPSAKQVNDLVLSWAREDGLIAQVDAIGNIRITCPKHDPTKGTFFLGSHLDSVINAGKYDGPLGFLMAYEIVANIAAHGQVLPINVEAVAFSDEEGVRFHTSYLGSQALVGNFDLNQLDKTDGEGIRMHQALEAQGFAPEDIPSASHEAEKFLGYFEVHIEQGPVLERENLPVGLVENIYGQARIVVHIKGTAGHAGTVPMNLREDALCAFSEINLEVEKYGRERKQNLVATVGQCKVLPGASNVIPDRVVFTLDIRSGDMAVLQKALSDIQNVSKRIAQERHISMEWEDVQINKPVHCDPTLKEMLAQSIHEEGIKKISLSSGAGHDAVAISAVAPVSMLFVRCREGISHNPAEYASPSDIQTALAVSDRFIEKLLQHYPG